MQNSKRSEEFGLELAIPFGLDLFIIQPDYVAWGVAPRLHAFVVSSLLKLLGVMEVPVAIVGPHRACVSPPSKPSRRHTL